MPKLQMVYITCRDKSEAEHIAQNLVREKLAACANILPGMESIYEWKGSLCKETECILILKTTSKKIKKLVGAARKLHSYDVPCIVSWKIENGHPPFLKWVNQQTSDKKTKTK